MKKLDQVKAAIEKLNNECALKRSSLQQVALGLIKEKLDDSAALKAAIEKLESSRDLMSDGEYPARWIRFQASDFIDTDSDFERDLFETYMMDSHNVMVDFQHDSISISDGPCMVINDDGDVLDQDSGKWIISHDDYSSESERNMLIEAWMTKAGYYPSVVREDRHGNMFYLNTTTDLYEVN